MTPQERRALLGQLRADLIAEQKAADAALKPLAQAYGTAANRAQRLSEQRQRVEDALNWFHPGDDPLVAPPGEADLDAALNRG